MNVAIIPARGGSVRIPRKNIREFAGKPLIAHSIQTAAGAGLFDHIIVSTDDVEIAEVSRSLGAEVPFTRPAELADNHTGTSKVVAHAIQWIHREWECAPAAVCCIYATAPFMTVDDLRAGLERLQSGNWRFVFSATPYESPIFRSFRIGESGAVKMLYPDDYDTRSQDLPEALHDAGQFYWGTPDAWLSEERIFDSHSTVVRIPRWRVHDIDTEEDWIRAEQIAALGTDMMSTFDAR